MKTYLYLGGLFLFFSFFTFGQSTKTYFDRTGKSASETSAYYYREKLDGENQYKCTYISNNAVYFEGNIISASNSDENLNKYQGPCSWYYRNGKKKFSKNFNTEGKEDGTSTYFYESGKIWKEIELKNGKIVDNRYKEYSEDGQMARIFEENFNDNSNDWDLYKSDKNFVSMKNGKLELLSFVKEGTSRYINISTESDEFAVEAVIDIKVLKDGDKTGLLYGFKDWQNYNFFYITNSSFYIGFVYEGIISMKSEGMYSNAITKETPNTIKVISNGEKNVYSINGEIQYSTDRSRNFGNNLGIMVSGKSSVSVDKIIFKEFNFNKGSNSNNSTTSNSDLDVKASGSGIVFGANGYILTNYHVVENANKVLVEFTINGEKKSYSATVAQKDIDNDLAILKINDESFKPYSGINYSFKENGQIDIGASVFTIGYPFALSGMGKDAKFTDGKVSSKTGYNGAINAFQTSIPVQPGNSGGAVFNEKGELVGVINSKVVGADNVSYAIKLNYIKNLVEVLPETVNSPSSQSVINLSLEEKIKALMNYVVLIKIK
ncbi:MAG: trypsin-like peptidase domain-containing protein [Bacteroidota bacterium]|nr:trypsin-like peptidase domain-containing protein [Bacteroidota bacterium]